MQPSGFDRRLVFQIFFIWIPKHLAKYLIPILYFRLAVDAVAKSRQMRMSASVGSSSSGKVKEYFGSSESDSSNL